MTAQYTARAWLGKAWETTINITLNYISLLLSGKHLLTLCFSCSYKLRKNQLYSQQMGAGVLAITQEMELELLPLPVTMTMHAEGTNTQILFPWTLLYLIMVRDEPILPAKFLEKQDYESKEQNSGKIGGASQQNQILYLNE